MAQQAVNIFNHAFCSFLGMSFSCVVAAEQLSQEELFNLSLEQLMNIQVKSSTLTEKTIIAVPSSVTIFTHAQIQTMAVDTLEDLLNFVAGFQSFRQAESSNEYYHSARGRRAGTASREVLILIDGQRFNQEYTAATGTPMIGLNNVDKIEIIRGPGSALYGSNAFTAVINITTLKNINQLKVSGGSNNHKQGSVLYSGKKNELALNIYANAVRDGGNSYLLENAATHDFYTARDPYKSYDFNVGVESGKTRLNFIHSKQTANDFYVLEELSNQYNTKQQQYSSLQLQQTFNIKSNLSTQYALRYYEWSTFLQLPVGPSKANAEFNERAVEFSLHNNWLISNTHSLQFGAERRHITDDKVESHSVYGTNLVNEAAKRDITGVYLQNLNSLTADTELTLGVRYDSYSGMDTAVSPRFGLTHQLSNTQTLKLLYGSAFRAPAFGERNVTSDIIGVGNPELKPETIETIELIWIGNWKRYAIAVTGFNSQVHDSIVQSFDNSLRQYVNADVTEHSQGVEIAGMVQFTSQWQVRGQYSLFNKMPDSAFRQADNVASLIVNYQANQWNFNLSAHHAAEREMLVENDRLELNSYWLLDSKIQYAFKGGYKSYLQIKNVADKSYFTPSQGESLTVGIPNRGREFSVGVQYDF